jgi:hypothetical protein
MRTTCRLPAPTLAIVAVAALLTACVEPEPEPPDPVDQGDCGAIWGDAPADGRIYVDAAAEPDGDGSLEAPFELLYVDGLEVDSGLEAARESGIRSIVLAPGEYAGQHVLSNDIPDWLDSGLEIVGCGADQTSLVAVVGDDEGDDVLQPALDVSGATTADIQISDLSLVGGRRGLVIRDGAGELGAIVVERVQVLDSVRVGVLVAGFTTRAHLVDVDVGPVEPEDGFGWGVAFQTVANPLNPLAAPCIFDGGSVTGATEVGILADGAWLDLTDVTVIDTAPRSADGTLGRGVQYQNRSRGLLDGLTVEGSSDAALFLHMPGRDDEPLHVVGASLHGTLPGADDAGDGLAITQADAQVTPETFLTIVDEVDFAENPRSHLLVEGVLLQVGPDNIFGKGTDFPFASQAGALVEGIDGGEPGATPVELGAGSELAIQSEPLSLDDLLD